MGKTATALQRANQTFDLSAPPVRETFRAALDPLAGLQGTTLIDEWQREPSSWDQVKRAVDAGARPGSFIVAGSSAPPGATIHSGAGRILNLRMRPLSLAEREIETPTVSLARLLDAEGTGVEGHTAVDLRTYVSEILGTGFPGLRRIPEELRRDQIDSYVEATVNQEFAEQGLTVRRPSTLRAWMAAYFTRLAQGPKHLLADPGLAARLLGVSERALLGGQSSGPELPRDGTLLGALFEHLVALSVQTCAQAARARVSHLRTQDGTHEVDLVVERDGALLAIEVKLSATVDDDDVRHLHWLRERVGDDLVDAVVVSTGPQAYRRADGIAVVPAALLGP